MPDKRIKFAYINGGEGAIYVDGKLGASLYDLGLEGLLTLLDIPYSVEWADESIEEWPEKEDEIIWE